MRIVPLETEQLDAVATLESSDGDVGWSRSQFEKELSGEMHRFFVVLEPDSSVIQGYGGYWKAGPEAQIINLVVGKAFRCRGIGKRLIEFLLDCARGEGCTTSTLEVRASNAHAQSLYKGLGFEVKGTRASLYRNPVEDAVLMEKKL